MNILKRTNENNDRFIAHRSRQEDTVSYFHMKEQLDDIDPTEDKMMVDASDESGNNEIVYNALLKSEILDISDSLNVNFNNFENENIPTSLTCLQKFSKSRKDCKKKFGYFEVSNESIFAQ